MQVAFEIFVRFYFHGHLRFQLPSFRRPGKLCDRDQLDNCCIITDASIDMYLLVENGKLIFTVRNRYNDQVQEIRDKTSGIGLNNVRRRLNLLYDKNHALNIEKKEGWFTVSLQLNLH